MCLGLTLYSFIKRAHNQRIVIMLADFICHDPAIIEIQYGTQIYFVSVPPDVILELSDIRQPFLVRCVCVKVTVEIVFGDMCRVLAASGAALWPPLDRGLNTLSATDPEYPLIVHCDAVIPFQFVPDSPVTHIRMVLMNGLDLLGELGIVLLTEADRTFKPAIIRAARKPLALTELLQGVVFGFSQFFDRLVFVGMSSQRERSFISNSLIFFNRSFSI